MEPSFTDSVFRFRFRFRFWIPDSGFRIPDSGLRIQSFSAAIVELVRNLINLWKDDDDEVMNVVWKSYTEYENCGVKSYMKEDHRSYRCNFCSSKRKHKKIQACTGFEPLTSVITVQRSGNWANKPTWSRSFKWFVIELLPLSYLNNENFKMEVEQMNFVTHFIIQ